MARLETMPSWTDRVRAVLLKKEIYSSGVMVDRVDIRERPEMFGHQILASFRVLVEDDTIQPKAGQWVRFPTKYLNQAQEIDAHKAGVDAKERFRG